MKALRVICKFLISLVQALFPNGLKGRHDKSGNPVVGTDSTVVGTVDSNGSGVGSYRSDADDDSAGSEPTGETTSSTVTTGNLLGWMLIMMATIKLFC